MRTVKPNLNDGYFDSDYLRAFNFLKLGENVRIHKTVVLPDPPSVSIGNNVIIGPMCALLAKQIEIGHNVEIKAGTIFDGNFAQVPDNSSVEPGNGPPEISSVEKDE